MRRKAVIKNAPKTSKATVASALSGRAHRHFCSDRECRLVYEDHCDHPTVNGRCPLCRTGRRGWGAEFDPVECCINNCTQVTDREQTLRYQLAGPGPWFQCQACARCHGWSCVI